MKESFTLTIVAIMGIIAIVFLTYVVINEKHVQTTAVNAANLNDISGDAKRLPPKWQCALDCRNNECGGRGTEDQTCLVNCIRKCGL